MQLDALFPLDISFAEVPELARAAEDIGLDALWMAETQHKQFLPYALISGHLNV